MAELKKIGIFGGSFDPVHRGHLTLARLAKKQLGLDAVYFVAAKYPPHKPGLALAPSKDRLNMLKLCLGARERISRFEIERPGTTYTWQTLKHFRKRFAKAGLFFILGGDSLCEIGSWKKPEVISKLCTIAAGVREGQKFVAPVVFKGAIVKLRGKIPNVSSTEIRHRIILRKPVNKLVEGPVAKYITKHHLYENIE